MKQPRNLLHLPLVSYNHSITPITFSSSGQGPAAAPCGASANSCAVRFQTLCYESHQLSLSTLLNELSRFSSFVLVPRRAYNTCKWHLRRHHKATTPACPDLASTPTYAPCQKIQRLQAATYQDTSRHHLQMSYSPRLQELGSRLVLLHFLPFRQEMATMQAVLIAHAALHSPPSYMHVPQKVQSNPSLCLARGPNSLLLCS